MKYLALILTLLVFIPTHAKALSCVAPDIHRSLESADTIFVGRITEVGGILSDKNVNEVSAIVETPYIGVEKGDEVTIYQQHWIERQPDWKESETDQKRGLFVMRKRSSSDTPVFFAIPQDIYYFGMCEYPTSPADETNLKVVEDFLKNNNVTPQDDAPNTEVSE